MHRSSAHHFSATRVTFGIAMAALALGVSQPASAQSRVATAGKATVAKFIDANATTYATVAQSIWDYAEVGYQEEKSSALLQQTLRDAGFTVEAGVAGIPTAFVAS